MEPTVILIIIFIIILIVMLIQYFSYGNCSTLDNFSTMKTQMESDTPTVLVFLSESCHYCKNWIKTETDVVAQLRSDVILKKIYPDNKKLFQDYNISAVPTAYVVYKNKSHKISGNITADNIESVIKSNYK